MRIKIAYLIQGTFNSGGMERVIALKANHLQQRGYQITIITTDQKNREPFYPIDKEVKQIDLGLNYLDDASENGVGQYCRFLSRQRRYKRKLSAILEKESFDIVISTFGTERYIVPRMRDKSIKIAESHFAQTFRTYLNRGGVFGYLDRLRLRRNDKVTAKYARFVILTHQDKASWSCQDNIEVIPNATSFLTEKSAELTSKCAIAVGRLTTQKGFDMLVQSWAIVVESHPDWHLDIFGSGEDFQKLHQQIISLGLQNYITINPPTQNISKEMLKSSIFLLSSRREGFGMVLVEAMGCGVPAVSFECETGPRDIITPGKDGILVEPENITEFAKGINQLIENPDQRIRMGESARQKIITKFSTEPIMQQWDKLFKSLAD